MFAAWDLDGDGLVTAGDLVAWARASGVEWDEEEVAGLLALGGNRFVIRLANGGRGGGGDGHVEDVGDDGEFDGRVLKVCASAKALPLHGAMAQAAVAAATASEKARMVRERLARRRCAHIYY